MAKTELTALTKAEADTLSCCETDIEKGGRLVASAMATIRDKKLYRQFGTFDDYCRERWGSGRSQVDRLIAHERVLDNLTPIGVKIAEAATREIADLPADQQVEIVKKAAENGEKPTAEKVKKARDEVAPKPEKKPKVFRADADMPPGQIDDAGAEVPANLIGVFETRDRFIRAAQTCREAAAIVGDLKKQVAGRYLDDEADCLKHIASCIDAAKPAFVDGRAWRNAGV